MATPTGPIVFDAYGTLLDVHSAVGRHAGAIGPHAGALSQLWRSKQLEYTWISAATGRPITFRAATEQGLDFACAQTGGLGSARREELLTAYERLDAYPEVRDVLTRLKALGRRTAILSNGDPDMLEAGIVAAGLDGLLDEVISVQDAGTFKPAPKVYALVTARFGVAPAEVTFVSSNRWDIAGAKAAGLSATWINRSKLPDEYAHLPADRVLPDLNGLI